MSTPGASSSVARRLESELDSKLVQLSRFDTLEDSASVLLKQIDGLLAELGEVNDTMSREASSTPGGTATAMHKLQRHREILHDLQQEFSRSKAQLKAATERDQLLSSVQNDIREHRVATSRASDQLLRERNAIGMSSRAADDVLDQAAATRDALFQQRGGFSGMSGKLKQLASLVPQVNSLLTAIGRRQRRDKVILASVIGICTALIIIYGFG